jgi:hypothetical protein
LALFLHRPALDGIDRALGYGCAATLNAILMVPVQVGLSRFGDRRLAAAYVLLITLAILEPWSLSAKIALAAGLLALAAGLLVLAPVLVLPRLRWIAPALAGLAAVALPLVFPSPLDAAVTYWPCRPQAIGLAPAGDLEFCR